jgi:AraC-like DNA-binding protein
MKPLPASYVHVLTYFRTSMKGATTINTEQLIVIDAPTFANPGNNDVMNSHLDLDRDLGDFSMKTFFHPLFTFHQVRADLKHDVQIIQPDSTERQVGLALMGEGRTVAIFGEEHLIDAQRGFGSFNFNPAMAERNLLFRGQIQANYFGINAGYLDRLLSTYDMGEHPSNDIKEKINNGLFMHVPVRTSSEHYRIMSDVTNCPLQGGLRNLMLEGSLMQLIALQFHSMGENKAVDKGISAREKEVMYGVKEYLDANFTQDHSLSDLSLQFGINQSKLKKNFKALFGVPVIEYVFNLKMNYAHSLIFDKGKYVAEVAPIVGYKNANHFATAFKRKFGVNPSQLRSRIS